MQPPSRQVHVIPGLGTIKSRQLPFQAWRMVRLNPRPAAALEECSQSFEFDSLLPNPGQTGPF